MSTHDENKRLYRIKPKIYVGWGHAQLQDWRDCNTDLEITAGSSDGTVLIRPAGTNGSERSIQFGHLVQVAPPLLSDEPDSERWAPWDGNKDGYCPLPAGTRFDVKFLDGATSGPTTAPCFSWLHNGDSDDIVGYRIFEPASDEPADKGVLSGADIRLFDGQWLNIVNHDDCYAGYSVEDAVAKAVALTEEKMAANYRDNLWPRSKRGQS